MSSDATTYRVAKLFCQGMNATDIAKTVPGVNRAKVPSLLRKALEVGMIRLHPPPENELKGELENTFSTAHFELRAHVFSCPDIDALADAASKRIMEILTGMAKGGKRLRIGIGSGYTLGRTISRIRFEGDPSDFRETIVYALTGGGHPEKIHAHANTIAAKLTEKIPTARHVGLIGPMNFLDKDEFDSFKTRMGIAQSLNVELDVVITSVGNFEDKGSLLTLLMESIGVSKEELAEKDCWGDLIFIPIDGNGKEIKHARLDHAFMPIVGLGELRQMSADPAKRVITVAGPPDVERSLDYKARPLLACIRGKLIDTVIVDHVTAEKLIELAEET